ncbi:MAG: hypothetical protein ACM3NT_09435 [Methylocystaceae bacterium]
MKRWQLAAILICSLIFVTGCKSISKTPENQSPKTVTNSQPFELIKDPGNPSIGYYLKFNGEDTKAKSVIAGSYWRGVSLVRIDKQGSEKELVKSLPFITRARWSADGRFLALMGQDELYVWDKEQNMATLVNEEVNTPSVTNFGFGPDNKIYTEHANLPNDAIYDPATNQGNPAYKIEGQPLYYKDGLGTGQYAATVVKAGTKTSAEEVYTVIADAQGDIISRVAPGRYRDYQGKSLLNVGAERFGLYYVKDYSQPQVVSLYSGYIYQTGFTPTGSVIYTRPGSNKQPYFLCSYNPQTKKTIQLNVSGPYFAVSTDGMIYGDGWRAEQIDAQSLQVKRETTGVKPVNQDIIQALQGAVTSYTKYYCQPDNNTEARQKELARWYINTEKPVVQSALFDVTQELTDRDAYKTSNYSDYLWSGSITSIETKGDRTSVVANLGVITSSGSGWSYDAAYELIKTNTGWKVTGLSTFPDSNERTWVEKIVKQFITRAEKGSKVIFEVQGSSEVYQKLQNKPLKIGQIQFWRMSEPHKSPDVKSSKHVKVYLKTGDKTYKLLLEKDFFWRVTGLSDQNLSGL